MRIDPRLLLEATLVAGLLILVWGERTTVAIERTTVAIERADAERWKQQFAFDEQVATAMNSGRCLRGFE